MDLHYYPLALVTVVPVEEVLVEDIIWIACCSNGCFILLCRAASGVLQCCQSRNLSFGIFQEELIQFCENFKIEINDVSYVKWGIWGIAFIRDKYLNSGVILLSSVYRCLDSFELKDEFREFLKDNTIEFKHIDVGFNQEPFLVMNEDKVQEVLSFVLNPDNQPVMVLCKDGKVGSAHIIPWITAVTDEINHILNFR